MLEDLFPEEVVSVVGDADEPAELEVVESCFFLDFAQGAGLDVFTGFLFALGQVPQFVAVDQQVFPLLVPDQAAARSRSK